MAVSIIVPVHNAGSFLEQAIRSVEKQTVGDWELILVDDGSDDGSGDVCDAASARDGRVRTIHTPNAGVSSARNKGLDAATGDWITFLDADDTLAPDALELMLSTARGEGANIVFAETFCGENEPPARRNREARCETISGEEATRRTLYQRGINASVWGKIYEASLWDGLRFRDNLRYEDLDVIYKVLLRASRVAVLSVALYFYRDHPGSFIHTFDSRHLDVLDVCEAMCDYIAADSPTLLPAARERRLSAAFNIYGRIHARKLEKLPEYAGALERCRRIILDSRKEALLDPSVRLKSKTGILASYLGGFPLLRCLSKIVYK